MKKVIFNINGGIGRCIAFTGVLDKFKEENPDVEVNLITSFPDVFANNPNINRVYNYQTPYIFEDVIMHMKYIEPEPYKMYEYYSEKKHIIDCFNLEVNGKLEFVKPNLYIQDFENENAKAFVSDKKPIVLLQPFGSTGGRGVADQSFRSLKKEFAKKLADKLKEKYQVYLLKAHDQESIEGIDTINTGLRPIFALLPYVKAVICVDSFLQHACYAMDKSAFVFWTATREENLSYDIHKNHRNGQSFVWSPIRIFANDPSIYGKNKTINEFGDKDIEACLNWVAEQ